MSNNRQAQGAVWFVTGASSGFGRAVVETVLERGGCVVATGRDLSSLEALANGNRDALPLRLDVTDPIAAREAIDTGIRHFGTLDVVFNNAGFGYVGAIEELTDEQLRQQLDVNLFGVINVTRAALPHMRKKRSGHIVQMASLNGIEPLGGGAYYTASKFAIEGFSQALAAEVAHLGIKVTIVEPGPARTRFLNDKSAKWANPIPDYEASVGKTREMLHALDGKQPVDPQRAARAIVRAVAGDRPPLHLPLGRMAIDHIRQLLNSRIAQLGDIAELAASADFPPQRSGGRDSAGGSVGAGLR
jgi:NAD(P)-dependent dehydrogenase (short-subunit alcohol dehydrogenase family)